MDRTILTVTLVILGLLIGGAFIRVVRGPRFTDRIIAVNAMNTMMIAVIAILSYLLDADYLADVALIYALLGLVANTLLARTLIRRRKGGDTAVDSPKKSRSRKKGGR